MAILPKFTAIAKSFPILTSATVYRGVWSPRQLNFAQSLEGHECSSPTSRLRNHL